MTEFELDCMQKLQTARSARRRVGAKRTVSLPSDNLNPAELQRRNGPCRVYRLGAPMDIQQFEAMPRDLQRTYLRRLRLRGGSAEGVRAMLGISPQQMQQILARTRVTLDQPDQAAWDEFLHR